MYYFFFFNFFSVLFLLIFFLFNLKFFLLYFLLLTVPLNPSILGSSLIVDQSTARITKHAGSSSSTSSPFIFNNPSQTSPVRQLNHGMYCIFNIKYNIF